jgi:hypothetical protein
MWCLAMRDERTLSVQNIPYYSYMWPTLNEISSDNTHRYAVVDPFLYVVTYPHQSITITHRIDTIH